MNKRLLAVGAAGLLAVVGVFVILAYVRDADNRAQSDVELVEVYVVGEPIAAGTDAVGIRGSIHKELVPANSVVLDAVTELPEMDGEVAAVDLVPGEQLLSSRLIDSAVYNAAQSAFAETPEGMVEITVSLEPERVLGGQIAPGDTVAVIATFDPLEVGGVDVDNPATVDATLAADLAVAVDALIGADGNVLDPAAVDAALQAPRTTHLMLNKILVTRIQLEKLPQDRTDANGDPIDSTIVAPTGNLLVTLAMEPHQVEQFVFTAEFGRIWLGYEPASVVEDTEIPTTRTNIFGHPHEDPSTSASENTITPSVDPAITEVVTP